MNKRLKAVLLALCLLLQVCFVQGQVLGKKDDTDVKQVLVKFRESVEDTDKVFNDIKKNNNSITKYRKIKNSNVYSLEIDGSDFKKLQHNSNIEVVEEDTKVKKLDIIDGCKDLILETGEGSKAGTLGDKVPWNVSRVKADILHSNGLFGEGIKIAVLDTGIDLKNNSIDVAGGISFVDGVESFDDDNGHGTAMAGILASKADGSGFSRYSP